MVVCNITTVTALHHSQEELDEWVNSERNRGTNSIGFAWSAEQVNGSANVQETNESQLNCLLSTCPTLA